MASRKAPARPHSVPPPIKTDSGLTFAPAAEPVFVSFGLPAGFATAPNSDGACALTVIEDRLRELGYPEDACHLWIIDEVKNGAFDLSAAQIESINQNGAAARAALWGQAKFWVANRLGDAIGNGNFKPVGILPDTFAFQGYRPAGNGQPEAKGISLNDLHAIVATWDASNYPRKPIVGQPFTNFPIGTK